jgi:hypothetical protein
MKLSSLPVKVLSESDRGSGVMYELEVAADREALKALLSAMSSAAEFSAPHPHSDGALEVRTLSGGFQIKEGRHGAAGTWRDTELEQAVQWVLPGVASLEAQRVGCSLWVPRSGA